jgi:hypothetical protein
LLLLVFLKESGLLRVERKVMKSVGL